MLQTSSATEGVIQTPQQQYPVQGPSEVARSHVHINQPYQPGPIDGTTGNNSCSRAGTLPPLVSPKVPLSASLCDSKQAVVEAAVGAFCDECWTAAHQAAGSAPSTINVESVAPKVGHGAPNADNEGSNSPLDQITAENTIHNRLVHFEVPQSSRITRDGRTDDNIRKFSNRADPFVHVQSGKLPQAAEKHGQTLQGSRANVQALSTTMQEGRRKALSSRFRATADKPRNGLAFVSDGLDVDAKESSINHGRSDIKDHLSVNDRGETSKKQSSAKKPRSTSERKSAELKMTIAKDEIKVDEQKGAAKEIFGTDKLMDAAKGGFRAKDVKPSVIEPKNIIEGDPSVSKSRSAVSMSKHTTKKDPAVSESLNTAKVSVPESHPTTKAAETDTSRTLEDPISVHVRKCEAGLLVCDYCSNLPAALTTDVGLFCDGCWDAAMQAEADRGVLTKPTDLSRISSVTDPATQKCVRSDRRVI